MDCHRGHRALAYFGCAVHLPRGHPRHKERAVLQGNLGCAKLTEWQVFKMPPIPLQVMNLQKQKHILRKLVIKLGATHISCQCTMCQACSAFSRSFLQAVKAVISLVLLNLLYPVSALPWTLVRWAKSSSQACTVELEGGLWWEHSELWVVSSALQAR